MISDWRGDRRIGPAPHWERAWEHLRFALLAITVLVAVSIFVTWIRTWGHSLSLSGYIRLGSAIFGAQVAVIAIAGLLGPNKERAITLGLIGGVLAAMVWSYGLPVLAALGIFEVVVITPVYP